MPGLPHHLLSLDCTPKAFRVMVALYNRSNASELAAYQRGEGPAPKVWPSCSLLRSDTGYSESSVRDATAELAKMGVIERADCGGRLGWALPSRNPEVQESGGPGIRTSEIPDPLQVSGPPLPPPSHTLPPPTPPEQANQRESGAQVREAAEETDHATPPEGDHRAKTAADTADRGGAPIQQDLDVRRVAGPPGVLGARGESTLQLHGVRVREGKRDVRDSSEHGAAEGLGPKTGRPGVVASAAEPLELGPVSRRKAGRKSALRPEALASIELHRDAETALDALHAARLAIGQTNRKQRPPVLPGDLAALVRPLKELDLHLEGSQMRDWSWWPRVCARYAREVKATAARLGCALNDERTGGKYLTLENLSRPHNFRRYWERDYLDRDVELEPAAPPQPRTRAPRPTTYQRGDFARDSDME